MALGATLVGLVEPFGGALVTTIGVVGVLLCKLARFLLGWILRLRGFCALSSKFLLLVGWERLGLGRGGSSRYRLPMKGLPAIRIFCRSESLVHVCTCRRDVDRVVGHGGASRGSCRSAFSRTFRRSMGCRCVLVSRSIAKVQNWWKVGFDVVLDGCGMTLREFENVRADERSVNAVWQISWHSGRPMRSPASADCSNIEGAHYGCRAQRRWVQRDHE